MIQTVIVAGLAGTRLVRAWLYEDIGEPFRDPLEDWSEKVNYEQVDGALIVTDGRSMLMFKSWVNGLITCPHCLGAHFAFWCVIGLRYKITRPLVLGLAAATVLSAFADHYPQFKPEQDG